jgi:hypothetical protein
MLTSQPENPLGLLRESCRYRITEVDPIAGNRLSQEFERRVGELGARFVAFIVRHMLVHDAPQPLD